MPRTTRDAPGGLVYHALNRANARAEIFSKPADYEAFEQVLTDAVQRIAMRLAAYCLMPNHWHLVLWPRKDGDLSRFMRRKKGTQLFFGYGTGRQQVSAAEKSCVPFFIPVQTDTHFLTVCRYVERNALRAKLVRRAEDWRWCSLWRRQHGAAQVKAMLSAWPVGRPRTKGSKIGWTFPMQLGATGGLSARAWQRTGSKLPVAPHSSIFSAPSSNWRALVSEPQTGAELEALRRYVQRGSPYGRQAWQVRTAKRLGLESAPRPRGCPKKQDPH